MKQRLDSSKHNGTDDFMYAVEEDADWELHFELETGERISRTVKAKELFRLIAEHAWSTGEPGLAFIDAANEDSLLEFHDEWKLSTCNPCHTADMKLLTENGYRSFGELSGSQVRIINKNGEVVDSEVFCSGEKEAVRVKLSGGIIIECTPNHKYMLIDGTVCLARDLKRKRIMPYIKKESVFADDFIQYGFIQGDGCLSKLYETDTPKLLLNIGQKDDDVLPLFNVIRQDLKDGRHLYVSGFNEKLRALGFSGEQLPQRVFPSTYKSWTHIQKRSFLRGCYSANGSLIKTKNRGRVAYKTTCKQFADELVRTLIEDFALSPYVTTNKPTAVLFSNGEYFCKESYDINLGNYQDLKAFYEQIGFIQNYKEERLYQSVLNMSPVVSSVTSIGTKPVYDFTEPKTHWGVVEGFIAHNCGL